MSKAISYFVAYRIGNSYGRAPVLCNEPIRGMEDIVAIEDHLKTQCVDAGVEPRLAMTLIVVNWQRFEETILERKRLITGNGN